MWGLWDTFRYATLPPAATARYLRTTDIDLFMTHRNTLPPHDSEVVELLAVRIESNIYKKDLARKAIFRSCAFFAKAYMYAGGGFVISATHQKNQSWQGFLLRPTSGRWGPSSDYESRTLS